MCLQEGKVKVNVIKKTQIWEFFRTEYTIYYVEIKLYNGDTEKYFEDEVALKKICSANKNFIFSLTYLIVVQYSYRLFFKCDIFL